MTADYGEIFKKTFTCDDEIRMLKRRLYAQLRGIDIDCIVDGYEACIAETPRFCPTVPDIVGHVKEFAKAKKTQIENKMLAEQIAALPAPTLTAQPERVFDMLHKAQQTPKGDEEARLQRLAANLEKHEALIASHIAAGKVKRIRPDSRHKCAVSVCDKPGEIAHSRGGNFYCAEHFTL
jgi:hypothetical protein